MDIKSILAAAAKNAVPEAYSIGGNKLYIRRFTSAERAEFFEKSKAVIEASNEPESKQRGVTRLWVIGFGLCDENNHRLYDDPAQAETELRDMMIEDMEALEKIVYRKLGIKIDGDNSKKD